VVVAVRGVLAALAGLVAVALVQILPPQMALQILEEGVALKALIHLDQEAQVSLFFDTLILFLRRELQQAPPRSLYRAGIVFTHGLALVQSFFKVHHGSTKHYRANNNPRQNRCVGNYDNAYGYRH
jgi:hypothetical protein